ncbi:MAG: PAS domain S-box protein, partial [Acidobacteria bacterium]
EALNQAVQGAKDYDLDHRVVWPDGTIRWVHAHAQLTRDAEGAPETLLGTVVDVTERRRAEDQLREFSQRLNYHVENSPLAVIEWGPDMRLTRWSGEAERIFGWRADEVLGKRMEDFRLVHREDESTAAEVSAALRQGRTPNRLSTNRNYRKDGSVAYCEWYNSSLLGESGEVRSVLSLVLDVTERKKAEEALSEKHRELMETVRELEQSRSMLQLIIESIPTRVFWKDRDLRYLGCNRHFARDAGFSDPHQLMGKDDFAMGWREQAELYRADDRKVMASRRPTMNIVEPQTTPDGATIWLSTSKVPLQRADGEVVGILGVYDDVTERRRAEEALRESEERYRSLFEQSPIGIYRTTPDGRILLANPALLTMLGYDRFEELVARNLETTGFEPGYPRERFKEILEHDGELKGFEAVWTTKSGTAVRVVENARAVRGADGAILHYEGTVEDITARTLAEEERTRLSAAIEQAAEVVIVTDREGAIQYVNPAFERVTGYGRDEVLGRTPRMLKSGSHDAAFYKSLWDTITAGEVWSGHVINRRKNGSTYEEETTISPVRGPDGGIVNYVAVKRDVTHEVALQHQLNQAQKMEAVGRLAGGIAHDFNNLLQALLTHAQLLRAHAHDPDHIREEAAKLEQDVSRGTGLIRQLLLFSRQETSRFERIDLNDVALTAADMLRRLVRENIVFALELADRPAMVEADRGQLEQVLMNLVVNASDAMEHGGRLVIRTGHEPHASSWLEVEDSGQGIPESVREHIFEPFFTTKEPGKGTGLGLSVVHGIVARHHGRLELDTSPGNGSRFRVLLPHAGQVGFDTASAPAPGPQDLPVGFGERILVVEDEAGAREGLKEILVSLGYDVVAVGSGSEAGRLAAEPAFALLLTDLLLPDVAGHDLAVGLQGRWPKLAVVLMSGYAEDEAVRRGIEAGRIRFLQKPFNMQTLATAVRAALDERRPSRQA